MFLTFR